MADQKKSLMNIVIAGTEDAIVMVESGALEVSEEAVVDALEFGHAQIKKIVGAIKELHAQLKIKKVTVAAAAVRRVALQGNRKEVRRETCMTR